MSFLCSLDCPSISLRAHSPCPPQKVGSNEIQANTCAGPSNYSEERRLIHHVWGNAQFSRAGRPGNSQSETTREFGVERTAYQGPPINLPIARWSTLASPATQRRQTSSNGGRSLRLVPLLQRWRSFGSCFYLFDGLSHQGCWKIGSVILRSRVCMAARLAPRL